MARKQTATATGSKSVSLYMAMFGYDDGLNDIVVSHTKGFVADGRVAAEGSTNFSAWGEGTFVVNGRPGGAGYLAQNNTQSVVTDIDTMNRFQAELIAEHLAAQAQAKAAIAATATPAVPPAKPPTKLPAPAPTRAASPRR